MKSTKLLLLPLLIATGLILALIVLVTGEASAWVDKREDTFGFFTNEERDANYYYCDWNTSPCDETGGSILPMVFDRQTTAIPNSVNTVTDYYNFLRTTYDKDPIQQSMVAFIVHTMLGTDPNDASRTLTAAEWADLDARLKQPGLVMERDDWHTPYPVYHQGRDPRDRSPTRVSNRDAAWLDDGIGQTDEAIIFRYNGKVVYAIFVVCANLDGSLATSLPELKESDFEINPKAEIRLNPDDENPNKATFSTGANVTMPSSASVGVTFHRSYFIKNGAVETPLVPQPASPHVQHITASTDYPEEERSLSGLTLGDEVCVRVTVAPAAGTVMGGSITVTEASKTAVSCKPLVNKPYFNVFGGDIMAGRGVKKEDGSCTEGDGRIASWTKFEGGKYSGAGSHLAVFALGEITDFLSKQRQDMSTAKDLTFANTIPEDYGGKMTVDGISCAENYWQSAPSFDVGVPSDNWSINSSPNGVYKKTGNLKITSSGDHTVPIEIASGHRATIYVRGDVYIEKNLLYQEPIGGFESAKDLSAFRVIASGNIYIDSRVTTLYGIFVSTGGTVHTCAYRASETDFRPADQHNLDTHCRSNRLDIWGAVIANRVKLSRTGGTVRGSTNWNQWAYGDDEGPAERIIYTPDVWLTSDFNTGRGNADAYNFYPPPL